MAIRLRFDWHHDDNFCGRGRQDGRQDGGRRVAMWQVCRTIGRCIKYFNANPQGAAINPVVAYQLLQNLGADLENTNGNLVQVGHLHL